jgi:hypothetical protein
MRDPKRDAGWCKVSVPGAELVSELFVGNQVTQAGGNIVNNER